MTWKYGWQYLSYPNVVVYTALVEYASWKMMPVCRNHFDCCAIMYPSKLKLQKTVSKTLKDLEKKLQNNCQSSSCTCKPSALHKKPYTSSKVTFRLLEEAFWFVAKIRRKWKIVPKDGIIFKTCTVHYASYVRQHYSLCVPHYSPCPLLLSGWVQCTHSGWTGDLRGARRERRGSPLHACLLTARNIWVCANIHSV